MNHLEYAMKIMGEELMTADRKALSQIWMDYDINGLTGSHMGNREQMMARLVEKLMEAFPGLDALYGMPEPVTEQDIRSVLVDAGLSERVTWEFGQFPQ